MQYTARFPQEKSEWKIIKGKFNKDEFEVLVENSKTDKDRFWIALGPQPTAYSVVDRILNMNNELRITGSASKYLEELLQ